MTAWERECGFRLPARIMTGTSTKYAERDKSGLVHMHIHVDTETHASNLDSPEASRKVGLLMTSLKSVQRGFFFVHTVFTLSGEKHKDGWLIGQTWPHLSGEITDCCCSNCSVFSHRLIECTQRAIGGMTNSTRDSRRAAETRLHRHHPCFSLRGGYRSNVTQSRKARK